MKSFLAAPEENLIWGKATSAVRDDLTSVPEQTLFPGLAIVALALVGLRFGALPRRLRIGLGAAVVLLAFLSLGFHRTRRRILLSVSPALRDRTGVEGDSRARAG